MPAIHLISAQFKPKPCSVTRLVVQSAAMHIQTLQFQTKPNDHRVQQRGGERSVIAPELGEVGAAVLHEHGDGGEAAVGEPLELHGRADGADEADGVGDAGLEGDGGRPGQVGRRINQIYSIIQP